MQTFTLESYAHMREYAGWSYRPAFETAELGRVRSNLTLARAEYALRLSGATVQWEAETDPDSSWMDSEQLARLDAGDEVLMMAVLRSWSFEILGSLGNIHMAGDWRSDPYRRVVEAELALEAGLCHPLDRNIAA